MADTGGSGTAAGAIQEGSSTFWDSTVTAGGSDPGGYFGDTYSANPWNYCTIAGQKTPGIAEVQVTPKLKLDQKKANGRHGSTHTKTGYDDAEVDIKIYMWTPEQWAVYEQHIVPIIWPPAKPDAQEAQQSNNKTKKRETAFDGALSFVHPNAALYRVSAVVVTSPSGREPGRVVGEGMVRIKAKQWQAPSTKKKPVTKTVKKGYDVTPEYKKDSSKGDAPPSPVKGATKATYAPSNDRQTLPSKSTTYTNP